MAVFHVTIHLTEEITFAVDADDADSAEMNMYGGDEVHSETIRTAGESQAPKKQGRSHQEVVEVDPDLLRFEPELRIQEVVKGPAHAVAVEACDGQRCDPVAYAWGVARASRRGGSGHRVKWIDERSDRSVRPKNRVRLRS